MYLYQFSMKKLPFSLTPDTESFCELAPHMEALNVLNFAINSGEAIIKVIGEIGTGKTLLCRMLLNQMEEQRVVAYIPYPKLSAKELKFSLAKELGIRISANCREDQLTQRIQTRLLNINKKKGPVVLLVDEAQVLDEDGLETLRLLTNLETEKYKLIQIVLFAQPELDRKLEQQQLRQINQRIVFSYYLTALTLKQVKVYVNQRLVAAGQKSIRLDWLANLVLTYYSKGIPRLINILCHKALLLAFGQNKQEITAINLLRSAKDTDSIKTFFQDNFKLSIAVIALLMSSSAMAIWGIS